MFLSSCDKDLGVRTEFPQESQVSSRVEAWNSAFFSSCKSVVRSPVELRGETWAFSSGATGKSDLPSCCEGIPLFPFDRCRGINFARELNGNLVFRLEAGSLGLLSTFNM